MSLNLANLSISANAVDQYSDMIAKVFDYNAGADNKASVSQSSYWFGALVFGNRDMIQCVCSDGNILLSVRQLGGSGSPVVKLIAEDVGVFVL